MNNSGDCERYAGRAADAIGNSEVIVVTAGAGMGVDSGLPDFRGNTGFWKAYPPYARLGLSFVDAANPEHFSRDPAFGWGFYGHRTNLYRSTVPHAGFHIIQKWIKNLGLSCFIVTSNVDGQFQRAGYPDDRIVEIHGSIHWLQCTTPCCDRIWPNAEQISVDESTMRAGSIPRCPSCGKVSRPNILMFGDWAWLPDRTSRQELAFERFKEENSEKRMVVIEMGAGSAIPTIRSTTERLGWHIRNCTAVRINPREPEIASPHISMATGALEGLMAIDRFLS